MIFIGIDPGITGAIAMIDSETREVRFVDTPTVQVRSGKKLKNMLNTGEIVQIFQSLPADKGLMVTIEKVNAMPGLKLDPSHPGQQMRTPMGVTSAFNFGMGFGIWIGVLAALMLPYQQVHPLTWKKSLMFDMGKEKDASRVKAMQLYPSTSKDLNLKKHHGRADALLIAEWGRRSVSGITIKEVA